MTLQVINLGNVANDGRGDDLRVAFQKVNANFAALVIDAADTTGTNLGSLGARVFKEVTNNDMKFRRLVAGYNMNVIETDNTIEFSMSGANNIIIVSDTGSLIAVPGGTVNIVGGEGISVTANENTKTLTIVGGLVNETTPALSANLDADGNSITNINNINGTNWDNMVGKLFNLDFGAIPNSFNNMLDFIVRFVDVDMGTIVAPSTYIVDMGPTGSFNS
jgi:hypothetical protein